jgi:hypothetical protein
MSSISARADACRVGTHPVVPFHTTRGQEGNPFWPRSSGDVQPHYYAIEELIELIDVKHRRGVLALMHAERNRFLAAHGSSHNHQAWVGGWLQHVTEVMNIAVHQYALYAAIDRWSSDGEQFSLSDLLVVLFVHDLEKPWKYEQATDGTMQKRTQFVTKSHDQDFRMKMAHDWGMRLTDAQKHAVRFAEGELEGSYSAGKRGMTPLAAMAHICDVFSARIYYDHPVSPVRSDKIETWPMRK